MNMQIKKIWLGIVIFSMFAPQVVHAQDLTCAGLSNPEITKNFIITIVEEQIGDEPESKDIKVLSCARETKCDKIKDPKTGDFSRKCTSVYKEVGDCNPDYNEDENTGEEHATFCQKIQVFYGTSGIELLFSYIGQIYRWAAGIIGIVSVFYLVYGGIRIAISGDDAQGLEEAKTKIVQSIAGLVLLFLSAIILYTINPNFFTL
jgi:hypothetical protein